MGSLVLRLGGMFLFCSWVCFMSGVVSLGGGVSDGFGVPRVDGCVWCPRSIGVIWWLPVMWEWRGWVGWCWPIVRAEISEMWFFPFVLVLVFIGEVM